MLGFSFVSREDIVSLMRRHPVWRESPLHLIKSLSRSGRVDRFHSGATVIRSGTWAKEVHLLIEGHVRVFYVASKVKREVTVKIIRAPAAFGESESILKLKRVTNVQALVPSTLITFPAEIYFRFLSQCPHACFRQFWDLGSRFGLAMRTEKQANVEELESRLVILFVSYADAFGHLLPDGVVRIEHDVDQDSLAAALGSARRTVARALSRLYERHLVLRRGRDFIVPDLEKLRRAADDEEGIGFTYSMQGNPWALHNRAGNDSQES